MTLTESDSGSDTFAGPPFSSFYFDCDSTLARIEGVDELLRDTEPELRAEILELTRRAMEGELPLADVYESRLRMIAPDRRRLERVGAFYVDHLVDHAAEVVAALQHLGKTVGIVSGGLLLPVQTLARHLGIPLEHAHAVPILFDDDGRYVDFDHQSPLWKNDGKIEVLGGLPADARPVLYVGDGVTDLETQGTVDLFVGFGGVAVRSRVREQAEAWIERPTLAPVLKLGLTAEEQDRLARDDRFQSLLRAARA